MESTPTEIWDLICQNLSRQDLREVRLVCKKKDLIAQRILFRDVSLFRNTESFDRLRNIVESEKLSKLVKVFYYSGKLLNDQWVERHDAFAYWLKSEALQWKDRPRSQEDLKRHFARSMEVIEAQRMVDANTSNSRFEVTELTRALVRFPRLEAVIFDASMDVHPIDRSFPGTISRDTRMLPVFLKRVDDFHVRNRQTYAINEALGKTRRELKSYQGLGIEWTTFGFPENLHRRSVEKCRRIAIELQEPLLATRPSGDGWYLPGLKNVAATIADAPLLQTLELSLTWLPLHRTDQIDGDSMQLSNLLAQRQHWPHLRRLKLKAFLTTEMELANFFHRHAGTLKSLELSCIGFAAARINGESQSGSWTNLFNFMQQYLSLENVCFQSTLHSANECWIITEPTSSMQLPEDGVWLKDRVQGFVVHGGKNPLQNLPNDTIKTEREVIRQAGHGARIDRWGKYDETWYPVREHNFRPW